MHPPLPPTHTRLFRPQTTPFSQTPRPSPLPVKKKLLRIKEKQKNLPSPTLPSASVWYLTSFSSTPRQQASAFFSLVPSADHPDSPTPWKRGGIPCSWGAMTNSLGILDRNHKALVPTDVTEMHACMHAIACQLGRSMSCDRCIEETRRQRKADGLLNQFM